LQFTVNPSPSPEVYLNRYDSELYPRFESKIGSSHGRFAFDPQEARYWHDKSG